LKYSIGKGAVASEILYSLGRQVLGENSDKIGGIEELKVSDGQIAEDLELLRRALES